MRTTLSNDNRSIQILGGHALAGDTRWVLTKLNSVLELRGWRPQECSELAPGPAIIIGFADSQTVQNALAEAHIHLPEAPESLVIHRLEKDRLLVAGRDNRGLIYALTELSRALELSDENADVFDEVIEAVESPELEWRSMQLFLSNADLEGEWYYRESFWEEYLEMLVRCRYNNLSLTFGHQTSYLAPPYPFHVALPEYPNVRVPGLTVADRERNLEMLRRIAEMSQERGLHFTLSVWSQHDCGYGPPMVEGLDEEIRAECNALGLRRVLEACPAIDGVQFRMNVESGVPEDRQLEYWEVQFQAIAECGRPIRLDLRAKGLSNHTIQRAREQVPNTVISTKFWCEHLGQPYVMPAIQRADVKSYRRYGVWDLLAKPRDWDLVHRLWSAGTQRVLLWGDPEWVSHFAQSCHFGGVGFEVMAPLTNKGFENKPGLWPIITDPAYRSYQEEYQRYWMFYLLFGRLGYRSDTSAEVWRRELRGSFGEAAETVERGYRAASQVMPLLTTVQQWSASIWGYWPEQFAGRTLEADMEAEPSDPTQFYGVAEYVDAALSDNLCGKWTPVQVTDRFHKLAAETTAALDAASQSSDCNTTTKAFRGTSLDFRILAGISNCHADRLTAGMHFIFYQRTKQSGRLVAALKYLRQAREHWGALSKLADGVYHDNLVFGTVRGGHGGHWKDRLPIVDADIRRLEEMLTAIPSGQRTDDYDRFPGEAVPVKLPEVQWEPIKSAQAGSDLSLEIGVETDQSVRRVYCHHRPANQALPFHRLEMTPVESGSYRATIPGSQIEHQWDIMVFFEVMLASGDGQRWPDWCSGPPYFVIETCGKEGI
jgi:hypothetical protein